MAAEIGLWGVPLAVLGGGGYTAYARYNAAAAKVEVNVSSRKAAGSSEVRVQETPNLAISLTKEGKVSFQTSKEMFRYM